MDSLEVAKAEQALAQWEQPHQASQVSGTKIWMFAVPVGLGLLALAIWQKEWNYGLGAAAVLAGAAAFTVQNRGAALMVTVTTNKIVIGKRAYALSDLAGFWLAEGPAGIEVNLERKKPGLLPTTFVYPSLNKEETRQLMGQVLAELEPRRSSLGEQVSRYFRF